MTVTTVKTVTTVMIDTIAMFGMTDTSVTLTTDTSVTFGMTELTVMTAVPQLTLMTWT